MYYTLWAVRWCPRVTPSPSHTTNTALSLSEKSSPLLEIIGRNVLLSKCWQIVFTFFKHQKDCVRIPLFRYCGWYCERTQMWISLQMTHKNKFASLLYNLTRNHAVQFSLRWAVFNVAYNQKRGVSSFKLSPLVWFKVSSSPGCVHNAQTASWGWNWFDNFGEHFLQPTSSLQPKTFPCETGGETSLTQFSSV